MTSGPTPPHPKSEAQKNEAPKNEAPKDEAQYARKLALAILSTLESKGLLSKLDVDTILHVAHRTAMQAQAKAEEPEEAQPGQPEGSVEATEGAEGAAEALPALPESEKSSVLTAQVEVKRPLGPAVLGTRWVKSETLADTAAAVPPPAHEPDAVKVVGKSAGQDRPLGPAILVGKPQASTEPVQAAPKAVSPEEAERNMQALESRVQEQQAKEVPPVPARSNAAKQDEALVIDLNLD